MSFQEQLNDYMQTFHISSKELAELTGISMPTISRFKNGKREPAADSELLRKLAHGFAEAAGEKAELTEDEIYEKLRDTVKKEEIGFEQIAINLDALLSAVNMNVNRLSRHLNYDPSYISRIRAGKRKPSDVNKFINDVAAFISVNYRQDNKTTLAKLMGCSEEMLDNESECINVIINWLYNGTNHMGNILDDFLIKLDAFDLNEYISAIKFNEMKVPSVPFQIGASKDYYHMEGYMKAEIEWLKATVLSHSTESVIMYSDMPMEEFSKNSDFSKKWMMGMALMLKKGLHLNIIHNLNRSFYEMMIGLESWIPLYMTGQVSPYYLKGTPSSVFHHFLRVSGDAAAGGESIAGFFDEAAFHFCKNKEEVSYYRKRGEHLLSKAHPLMEIYLSDRMEAYHNFLSSSLAKRGEAQYRRIVSAPPLYTASEELLDSIFEHNHIEESDRKKIKECVKAAKQQFMELVPITDWSEKIYLPSKEKFESFPSALSLAYIFYDKDIYYTYDEYMEHIRLTKQYADRFPNYKCEIISNYAFRNINFQILTNNWAIISKNKSPVIHFVIKHPLLRQAIEDMIIPVSENDQGEWTIEFEQ